MVEEPGQPEPFSGQNALLYPCRSTPPYLHKKKHANVACYGKGSTVWAKCAAPAVARLLTYTKETC